MNYRFAGVWSGELELVFLGFGIGDSGLDLKLTAENCKLLLSESQMTQIIQITRIFFFQKPSA